MAKSKNSDLKQNSRTDIKFIIEHIDPELWDWSYMEYKHISEIVGKNNTIFTNIKKEDDKNKLSKFGKVYSKSIKDDFLLNKFGKNNICLLDPGAKETLCPKDSKKFKYIVLGGILGDYPRKKRTKKELTNTAGYVSWKILNGTNLNKIKFARKLKVKIDETSYVELPFSFVKEKVKKEINGKIKEVEEFILPDGYIEMVKREW
jgi:ribosome biogenesis SPOUT family RNA methylase Rps3